MAGQQLPVPEPMQCTGDLATNWKVFREAYTDYAMATELGKKEKAVQAATLKTVMGKECQQILERLELSREEMNDEEIILTKLESFLSPHEIFCTSVTCFTKQHNNIMKR